MWKYFAALMAVTLFFALPSVAAAPSYDRSTEITLSGSVLYAGEGPLGVYVIMKDRLEANGQVNEVMVHLAPRQVLSEGGLEIVAGDKIRVIGSRTNWNGSEIILAREVSKQGVTVALRERK